MRKKSFIHKNVYFRMSSVYEVANEPRSVVESMFKSYEEDMDGYYKGVYSYDKPFRPMYYCEGNRYWKVCQTKPWYWDMWKVLEDLLWNY